MKKVEILNASMPVAEALSLFTDERIPAHTSYPVINSEEKVIGMASRANIFRWAAASSVGSALLGSLLPKTELFASYPDEMVSTLADRMMEADIGRVPVIGRQNGELLDWSVRKGIY